MKNKNIPQMGIQFIRIKYKVIFLIVLIPSILFLIGYISLLSYGLITFNLWEIILFIGFLIINFLLQVIKYRIIGIHFQ